jgi:hypothetical protein
MLIMSERRVTLNFAGKVLYGPAEIAFPMIRKLLARTSRTDLH